MRCAVQLEGTLDAAERKGSALRRKPRRQAKDEGVLIRVSLLASLNDPFGPVWHTRDRRRRQITRRQVRDCIALQQFEAAAYRPEIDRYSWTLDQHAQRVAHLCVVGWSDPISIDVGVPGLGCNVDWFVEDGNHRLAAAIVRGDSHILAVVSGSLNFAAELFGINI